MNKKIIIAIVIVLVLITIAVTVWFVSSRGLIPQFGGAVLPLTSTYDVQQDYCGKVIDTYYCKCAFQGEDCQVIGVSDKDTAQRLVMAGFEKWVIEKQKEECAEKGGRWKNEVCRK